MVGGGEGASSGWLSVLVPMSAVYASAPLEMLEVALALTVLCKVALEGVT